MKKIYIFIIIGTLATFAYALQSNAFVNEEAITYDESIFLVHKLNPVKQNLEFYWKDDKGEIFRNFKNLKSSLAEKGRKLVFAMNAGMFKADFSPLGLYIENGETLGKLNKTKEAYGNFYLQPNGIFYLTKDNKPTICKTTNFKPNKNIKYATQSGPMLVIDGKLHSKFNKSSKSVHFRNGVGVLPNGDLLFVMSKKKVNFYNFAMFFKKQGCTNALYLDGFVSKTYLPAQKSNDLGGSFGVMIGETTKLIPPGRKNE